MDKLIEVVTYLGALSVAAERAVQFIKPIYTKYVKHEVVPQAITFIAGALVSYGTGNKVLVTWIPDLYIHSAVCGLLVSGGSGLWHDVLGAVVGFKSVSKNTN